MKSSKRMKKLSAVSCQLSAFSQDWIIAIGLEKAPTIGLCAQIRYHCVDSLTIRDKFCPEAPLEFGVFHLDHHGAGCDREAGQRPADDQARSHAPGEHLAEMAEVDRMANTRANARDYEPIVAVTGANFWEAAQLCPTEVRSCDGVQEDAGGK